MSFSARGETESGDVCATVLLSEKENWPVERGHAEVKRGMSQLQNRYLAL